MKPLINIVTYIKVNGVDYIFTFLLRNEFEPLLILGCWKYEPKERPNIQKVVSTLKTMISLKQNDMITLPNQKFLQSDIMGSVNNSSSAIIRITDWNQEVVENGDIDAQYNLA